MARISFAKPAGKSRMYITEVNSNFDFMGRSTFEFTGIIPDTLGSNALLQACLRGDGIDMFEERQEWRCIYCASANPIEHRHCSQCGGPRGWIL